MHFDTLIVLLVVVVIIIMLQLQSNFLIKKLCWNSEQYLNYCFTLISKGG